MGDVPNPNPNPLYIYNSSAGDQRSYNSHHQLVLDESSVPYLCSYAPRTFVSDPESDFLSLSFHGTEPLSDSESELDASSGEESDQQNPEHSDFIDLDEDEENQASFITNLFERPRAEDSNLCLGLSLGLGQNDEDMHDLDDFNCEVDLELGLGLGFGSENGGEIGRRTYCVAPEPKPEELAGVSCQGPSFGGGLRVLDIDSESDSDQNVAFDTQMPSGTVELAPMERVGDFAHQPLHWDYFPFNQQSNGTNQFEWQEEEEEEVYGHGWEFEASGIVIDPLVEAGDVLFDWYGERDENEPDHISIHSDPVEDRGTEDAFDEAFQRSEWEILFAVNNLSREFDDDNMFGVVEESMNEWRGNPPAAISVIETLPNVTFSLEELKQNEVTCSICWSEISAKEPVKQLPCHHHYHGDCIEPWLGIRNTCPVCRYELPTDDLEYEYKRRGMAGLDGGAEVELVFTEDLQDSYENFRVFL